MQEKTLLYITSKSNINYLTKFKGDNGIVLKVENQIYLITDKRYIHEIRSKNPKIKILDIQEDLEKNLLKILKKYQIEKIYFEEKHQTYYGVKTLHKLIHKIDKKIKLSPSQNIIENIRSIKTEKEIGKILSAQKITEKTLEGIKSYLKKGVEEKNIAWIIEKIGRDNGAQGISFEPIVCFGVNSAIPHHEPDSTKFKKGDIILLDFGFKFQGYCSDMTRTLFSASPTSLQEKVYLIVQTAQMNAFKEIKPGITGIKADSFARKIIKKAGLGENFTHSLGHGVGLDIHELPNLSPLFKKKKNMILQENMITTLEPGIYLEGKFGIRIEDMIVIGKEKNKNLTKAPRSIKESIINI